MLTVKAAAVRMGISESLVYALCACGSLPHIRIGRPGSRGCIRLTEADIQEFLASQKVGGSVPARVAPARQKKAFKHVVIPPPKPR
jgi:excisionase family DNA binding protein